LITVLTTPRRPQYLAATLAGLDAAGARDHAPRWVCVDGEIMPVLLARVVPSGWGVVSVGIGNGSRVSLQRVCELARRQPGGGDLLYFEDDLAACRNAVTAWERIAVPPDCGFLAAFDHKNLARGFEPRILRVASDDPTVGPYCGNQAIKIPGRTLAHLVQQSTAGNFGNSRLFGSDVWLGHHAASAAAPWKVAGILAPSLFQHVGAASSIHPHWKLADRTAQNWRQDFDALTLPELV
jgi:hypothetical protein